MLCWFLDFADDLSEKDELATDNSTSAAIPVPTRSLSRQSSVNCATPKSENACTSVTENAVDTMQQNQRETLGEDPCFSPLSRRHSADTRESRRMETDRDMDDRNNERSLSPGEQQTSSRNFPNTSITGLRSTTSSGYSSERPCFFSRKPYKMTFISPTSSGYASLFGGTVSSNKSCPTICSPDAFPCSQENRQSYPKVPGFRSQDPPKTLQANSVKDSSSYLEQFRERAAEPTCRSDPQRWQLMENNKENCKNECNRVRSLSRGDLNTSAYTEQCCKHFCDRRDASLDRSSVETCDASTSPHLPLGEIWKSEASSAEQVCTYWMGNLDPSARKCCVISIHEKTYFYHV